MPPELLDALWTLPDGAAAAEVGQALWNPAQRPRLAPVSVLKVMGYEPPGLRRWSDLLADLPPQNTYGMAQADRLQPVGPRSYAQEPYRPQQTAYQPQPSWQGQQPVYAPQPSYTPSKGIGIQIAGLVTESIRQSAPGLVRAVAQGCVDAAQAQPSQPITASAAWQQARKVVGGK